MAAPKRWGYDRDQEIGSEMLVAWSDGDLTEILVTEINERLLRHEHVRADVAAWARAAHDSSIPHGKDWIETPRRPLLERCKEVGRS